MIRGSRNYEACRAKGKKFLTVHGAEHAVSYYHDNDAYTKQATEFCRIVWPGAALYGRPRPASLKNNIEECLVL